MIPTDTASFPSIFILLCIQLNSIFNQTQNYLQRNCISKPPFAGKCCSVTKFSQQYARRTATWQFIGVILGSSQHLCLFSFFHATTLLADTNEAATLTRRLRATPWRWKNDEPEETEDFVLPDFHIKQMTFLFCLSTVCCHCFCYYMGEKPLNKVLLRTVKCQKEDFFFSIAYLNQLKNTTTGFLFGENVYYPFIAFTML